MIRLHHIAFSRSFRVLWLLSEMQITPDIVPYTIADGSLRSIQGLSPGSRVPALEIDGTTLFESGAILEYLCETRPAFGFGRPPGHPERARYLEILHFAETMANQIEQLNLQHLFLRPPAKPSVPVLKINTGRLAATLRGLQDLLGDQDHILPAGFSAADAMMGFNLFAAPYFVDFRAFPALSAYADRLAARPAFQKARALDGRQEFYKKPFYPIPEDPTL